MSQNCETIDVLICADNGIAVGLRVTLCSLFLANPESTFKINIFDGGLSDLTKSQLEEIRKKHSPVSKYTYFDIDQSSFEGFNTIRPGQSAAVGSYMTYARLLMPSLLTGLDKVLYLDCDILVTGRLQELWEINFDNEYVAAARDVAIPKLKNDWQFQEEAPEVDYFNAGILLVNLKRWREADVEKNCISMLIESPEKFKYWDQSALNALFRGEVKFISTKYNARSSHYTAHGEDTRIIHYLGPGKPWKSSLIYYSERLWAEFYIKYVASAEESEIFSGNRQRERKRRLIELLFRVRLLGGAILILSKLGVIFGSASIKHKCREFSHKFRTMRQVYNSECELDDEAIILKKLFG